MKRLNVLPSVVINDVHYGNRRDTKTPCQLTISPALSPQFPHQQDFFLCQFRHAVVAPTVVVTHSPAALTSYISHVIGMRS